MNARAYLSQAYRLDQRIESKVQQIESLNDLAEKCTSTLTGMPKNPSGSVSRLEDVIVKITDLQDEISRDMDKLVELKAEITEAIKAVENTEYQTVLEKRYLCYMTWEQIAVDLGYNVRHLYRVHGEALREVVVP